MMFAVPKLPVVSRKKFFEAFFTIGGRIISVFIIIVTTKFLTTFLSEAAYGQLALYTITATLPSTFFFGPLGQGTMRIFPVARDKNEIGEFHWQYQHLFKTGAHIIIATGVIASFICWLAGETKWAVACLLIALFNVVNSLNVIQYGLQNSARKRILALGLETGDRLLQQTIAIVLLLFVLKDPLIVLAGYLLASLIFMLINQHFYHKSFPETRPTPDLQHQGNYSKDILRYSWPFIVFGIFFWFQNATERWALALIQSTEMVGQYAVLNQIGFQSQVLVYGAFGYFLVPILYNKAGTLQNGQQLEEANRVNNFYLLLNVLLTFILVLLFWFFGKEIIQLLSDNKYEKVSNLLPFMALAGGLFNFGQNYSYRYMLSMQTQLLLIPKIATAIIGCIINIIAVWLYGLTGLISGLIITQLVYVFSLMICWKLNNKTGSDT